MALPDRPQEEEQSTTSDIEDAVEHNIANAGRWSKGSSNAYDLDKEGIVLLPSLSTRNLCCYSPESLRIVRFSTQQRVADASVIQKWFEIAGVTALHVGFEYQSSWDVVVVNGQCLQALPQRADDFTIESINPTEPSDREKDVYDITESTIRASERFLQNALDAIFLTVDNGVSCYYRAIAKQNSLQARLEIMVFCVEFETSASAVKKSFARNALILCLNLLGELVSSVALELLQRDDEDWYHHILDGAKRLLWLPLPSHLQNSSPEEIHLLVVSLLHGLLIVSSDEVTNPNENKFNLGLTYLTYLTPLDILILYGLAFEVQTPTPQQFGTSDLSALQKALSRSRIFIKVTCYNEIRATTVPEVGEWICHLKESLPIAFPDLALPSQLLSELGFREMKQLQIFREHTYEQLPSLNHSENDILLLLAWSSDCTGRALRAIHAWAISEHGQIVSRRLIEHLGLAKNPPQVMLSLVALLSFLRLQPYGPSSRDQAKTNHLSDFYSLLKGSPSCKARETLVQASWSFWIVMSDGIDAAEGQKIFQLLACVLQTISLPECSDEGLNGYWRGRFSPALSHNDAPPTISNVSKKFVLPLQSDPPRLNDKCTTIESEVASNRSFRAGGKRSSEYLVQSTNEKVSRARGCCRWGWFSRIK